MSAIDSVSGGHQFVWAEFSALRWFLVEEKRLLLLLLPHTHSFLSVVGGWKERTEREKAIEEESERMKRLHESCESGVC